MVTIKVTGVDEAPEITVGGLAVSGTGKSRLRRGQAGRRGNLQWRQGRNAANGHGGRLRATTPADFEHQQRRRAHLREGA